MSYINLNGKLIENDLDEKMDRKHGYNYGYLKYKYPNIHKLPEDEIKIMLDIVYEEPDIEHVETKVNNHIKLNKQRWYDSYFNFGENSNQKINHVNMKPYFDTNGFGVDLSPNLKGFGTYTTESSWGYPNTIAGSKKLHPVNYSLYGDGFSKEFIDQMLLDNRFQNVMRQRTLKNEGGYINHPLDKGGETNYGISSKIYPNEDIKNLTQERAHAIYYRDYWLKPKIHQLPDNFVDIVFDDAVVQGQPAAIINLQKALGVQPDGLIGANTLDALKKSDHNSVRSNFIHNIHKREDEYLKNNPSQKIFEKGHRKRYNSYW